MRSVVTEDLREVFEEISGQSWDRFFDQWVHHAGSPELNVQYRWLAGEKLAEVTVTQTQPVNDHSLLFAFPTRLRFYLEGKEDPVDQTIDISERRHVFHVPLEKSPRMVLFDPDMTVLAKVEFRKPEPMLLDQLRTAPEVIARIQAAEALGRNRSRAAVTALREALENDQFHGVRSTAAGALRKIDSDAAVSALIKAWDQDDARVRQSIVEELGDLYRSDVEAFLHQVIENEKNPAIVATATRALAKYSTTGNQRRFRDLLDRSSFREEIAVAAVDAMRRQDDPSQIRTLKRLIQRREADFETRDFAALLETCAQLARRDDDKSAVREMLLGYLEHPRDMIKGGALRALGTLRDRSAAEAIRSFTKSGNDRLAYAAEQSLRDLETQADSAPSEVRELRTRL
ncbi:MAG TPA: HEAT repeat domain-containing protein, partial [Pirellulaceae bacterium]